MALATRRLPLNALRTFEASARHLSFKNAAEELFVSSTTVSNQIRQLEKDWGCKLFHRKTRAVVLTDSGKSLARVLSKAFEDIRAEAELHLAATRKTVTIAVGPMFGSRWLGPRLSKFGKDCPGIELVVHHGSRITSAEQMTTDIMVDWGMGDWIDLEATKLMEARYSPIVGPKLIAQSGPLTEPSDLTQHTFIHQHDRSEWRNWFALAGYPNQVFQSEIVVIDSNIVQRSVKDDQGVALGVFPFHYTDVEDGTLVKPFDIDFMPDRAFYLLTRRNVRTRKEVRAVCSWIEAEAAAFV
jgi:LysR family glycine cleavage system transcriptional activator